MTLVASTPAHFVQGLGKPAALASDRQQWEVRKLRSRTADNGHTLVCNMHMACARVFVFKYRYIYIWQNISDAWVTHLGKNLISPNVGQLSRKAIR